MKKRVLSLFMALALCLTLLPTAAFAEGEDVSISGGVIGGSETGGEGGGIYVAPGSPTEGGGGTYIPGEDTRTEIWCVGKPSLIQRSYDGTTDGSTIPIDLTFTDGTNNIILKEGTGFTAKKTFDSADAGSRTVTVEIELIGDAAAKYKLKAGEKTFTIGGFINKAYPKLNVSLSRTTCTVGEKILPLLSVEGAPEGAAVTYYYTQYKSIAGDSECEGSEAMPAIDGNTAISKPGTYYVYAKTGETKNYEEERSTTAELTVNEAVVEAASVTKADGTDGGTYASLPAALDAAQDGDTVTLLSDVDLGETYVTIDKSITFDLGSKTLSSSKTWSSDGVLLVKDAAVTVKNGTVNATGIGNCAIHAYRSGASMTLEDVTATVTSDKSSVMVGDFGSAVIKSGDYQGLYVGAKSQVTLEGGTFRPYMDNITNKNVKSIFWKVNETTDATSRDCMELLGDGCVYVDENQNQVRTGGGFNTVVTVQQGTAIDAPVAKIGDVKYASLSKAIDAVQNGGTITLLNDLDLGNGAVLRVGSSKKDFTIDLDSHTLSADGDCLIMLHNGSQLTLKNGTLDGSRCTSYGGVLYISSKSGPKLTLENVTAKSGSAADSLNGQRSVLLAYVTYGTVVFDGGTYTGGVLLETDGNAVLKSGTFQKGTNDYSIKTKDSGKHLSDYLDDDSQFWNDNTPLNLSNETQTADEVTVRPCEHKWENGKCTVCQKVCDHGSADGKSMTEDPCPTCGMKAAAQVDITGSDAKYFPSFTDALVYATKNNGCTLKLLADVTGDAVMINNPFLFDLNGHNVDALSVDARATIKDSGTTKGRIGKVTVSTHKVTDLTLGNLLEEGYAFQYENGSWANDSHLQTSVGLSVTVRKAPIQSVEIYAKDKNNKEVSTIAYGTTGEVTLVSSCQMGETSGADLTYLWYKLEGAAATAPLEGATGANYTLPDNLAAGTHTYLLICTSDHYSKSKEITITVTKIDLANATVTIDPWHADGKFRFYPYASETAALSSLSAVKVTANGKEYTLSNNDFTYTGATATQVGNYKLTITATDSCANYKGSKTFDWEVIPYQMWRPIFQGSQTYTKTYDGTTTLPGSYTWLAEFFGREGTDQNVTLKSGDYEVTAAEFVSADAGENKPINQTITLKNDNFVFSPTEIVDVKGITTTDKTLTYTNFTPNEAYPTGGTTFNIEKATMPDFDKEVTLDIVNNHADTYTVDLSALLPKLESPRTYGEIEYSQPTVQLASGYYTDGHAKVENGKLILTIDKNPVTTTGSIGTVTVQVTTTNYKPVTLTVNLRSVNKRKLGMFVSVATDPVVYGMTLGDIKLSAEATVDKQVIPGTIAWEDPLTTVPAAGRATYRWTFTPDDTMHYLTASNTITFLVDKATPTGAPTYAAITTGGKTLADAPLTPNASWPSGTVQWVDKDGKPLPASTQVQANTKYTWSFTPADAANYNGATGSVTLYAVSSGGGGGSSSASKTSTTTNADGSVTKTEIKADGTVIATTTAKDGSVTRIETKPDGSSVTQRTLADGSTGTVKTDKNGQTEAKTALSSKAIEDAKRNGEPVKAPVEVKATRNSDTAPTVKIELPRNSGETKVEIPVSNVKPGTVAVLVHADGTEEIVKNSLPTEDGIQLTVNGGATVKIVDNSKDFADTRNHWAKDAIDFVSARGLVNGMNDSIYAPNASTTRAQLWTILARQNNADLTGGNTWYEKAQLWSKDKGVSDGANPNGTIDRAQMVTMLWRAAGQPTAGGTANFTDVPADSYYANAVSWAVEGGITTGIGGGRFDPNSTCTRAQIATFLWRAMAE